MKQKKSNIPIHLTINKFKESISKQNHDNNKKIKLNINKKEGYNTISSSPSSSRKIKSSRMLLKQNSQRSDKVEKKLYLENINMRNHINMDLLSKLSSTFKSFNFQSHGNDTKIESNLFNVGTKRSLLLRKSMNTVRNMIQDFDNQFSINFDINNITQKQNLNSNKEKNKYSTNKIKEESYSDFDFNLNKTINENNNKNLTNSKNFFREKKKGKIYLKNEKNIENQLKNEKKIIGLKDAFKYYELLYNYKYYITEKDILGLSFNRRKKMEKNKFEQLIKTPKAKSNLFKEKCEKCEKTVKNDRYQYNNNLNIHLFKKSFSDNNMDQIDDNISNINLYKTELNKYKAIGTNKKQTSNCKTILKRALSGKKSEASKKSVINSNSNSKFINSSSRPTSASTNKFQKFNQKMSLNSLLSSKKVETNLSYISSNTQPQNQNSYSNHKTKSNSKSKNYLSIKNKIKNLSENIISDGDRLKSDLKETYRNVLKIIEEEKKPVKKVKKKINVDIEKIRTDLNLKRRGGGIDEIKMIMDNVDKLYKSLPKKHVELMRSIAKIVINEDRRKNKPMVYNDINDNRLFKKGMKKEMFKASIKMREIRKSLSKHKTEKPFKEKLKSLLKNDGFIFFSIKSLKDEINKDKVLRGEIIKD